MRKLTTLVAAVVLLASLSASDALAKKKKGQAASLLSALGKDSTNTDYSRITKDAATQQGLFTVIFNTTFPISSTIYFPFLAVLGSFFRSLYPPAQLVA